MINPTYWLLVSIGKAERSLKIAMVLGPLVIIAYCIGLPYGPSGVAMAYSAAMMIWVVPHLIWCFHDTAIVTRDLLSAVGRPFVSAVMAVAVAYSAQLLYAQVLTPLPRLIVGCGIMVIVYSWLLLWVMGQKEVYLDLARGLRQGSVFARATA